MSASALRDLEEVAAPRLHARQRGLGTRLSPKLEEGEGAAQTSKGTERV